MVGIMHKFRLVSVVSTLALVLAGCGGGGDDSSKFSDPGSTPGGGGGSTANAAAITATSNLPSLPSDGSVSADITALVRDASNNLLPNVAVTFTASSGGIAVTSSTTDSNGAAHATLSTAGDASLRTITVTAKTGSLTSTVNVQVVAGGGSGTTVQMGSLNGSTFTPSTIAVATDNLSAGGSTSLQVALQKSDGTLYTQSADITFSSPCSAQGLATINSPVTTTTGIASATYVAKGCSGTDVVTATATLGSSPVSATGSVNVATAAVGSIQFESVSPVNIGLKGTGRPETATVVFKVLDTSGGPRANADVTFSLDTSVGGINLTSTTAKSDASGLVQTVVNSGTVATPVRVTARISNPNIATQSNVLTVTTGIPDTDSFSLAVAPCSNVEAFQHDGVVVPVTARLSDRFNNPVPDGTAIAFKAEGGQIVAQCTTGVPDALKGSGSCVANWVSSDPRPQTPASGVGRVSILATAIGEDTFTDTNSNGFYDTGEVFADLGEPYRDDDESGTYTSGEFFLDFDNNGSRAATDGAFSGVTCTGTTPGSTCNLTTTAIGSQILIVMSTDGAVVTGPTPTAPATVSGGRVKIPATQTGLITFIVKDANGNAMANASTIATTATSGVELGGDTNVVVPCDASRNGTGVAVTIKGTGVAGTSGIITVKVTSKPGNLVTNFNVPFDVT